MKKAIILFLALSSAIAYVTDMQAQTTERQDAVGKFRIVPAVMLTFNPYSVDDGRNNSLASTILYRASRFPSIVEVRL